MKKEKEPIKLSKEATPLVALLIEKKKFATIKSAAEFASKIEEQYEKQIDNLNDRQAILDKKDRADFSTVDLEDCRHFTRTIISNGMTAMEPWSIARESVKMAHQVIAFMPVLEDYTIAELKDLADTHNIDLGDAKKKAEILEVINENL